MLGIYALLLARSSGVARAPTAPPSRIVNGGGHLVPLAPLPALPVAGPRLNGGRLPVPAPRSRGSARCVGPAGLGGGATLVKVPRPARVPLVVIPGGIPAFNTWSLLSTAAGDSSGTVATLTEVAGGGLTATAYADSSATAGTLTVLAAFASTAAGVSSTTATLTEVAGGGLTATAYADSSATAATLTVLAAFTSTAAGVSATTALLTDFGPRPLTGIAAGDSSGTAGVLYLFDVAASPLTDIPYFAQESPVLPRPPPRGTP